MTVPTCGYCGRPVGWGDESRAADGVFYHVECTRPPRLTVSPTIVGGGAIRICPKRDAICPKQRREDCDSDCGEYT